MKRKEETTAQNYKSIVILQFMGEMKVKLILWDKWKAIRFSFLRLKSLLYRIHNCLFEEQVKIIGGLKVNW